MVPCQAAADAAGESASFNLHSGFHNGAAHELARVFEQLGKQTSPLQLWLTGHSLGGALAVCTALMMHRKEHSERFPFCNGEISFRS